MCDVYQICKAYMRNILFKIICYPPPSCPPKHALKSYPLFLKKKIKMYK